MKQFVKQMVPMVLIISITVVMSLFLYRRIMVKEEENCWSLLEESSKSQLYCIFKGGRHLSE